MTRIEQLRSELDTIKGMRCLSFDLKTLVREYYEHEIEALEVQTNGTL